MLMNIDDPSPTLARARWETDGAPACVRYKPILFPGGVEGAAPFGGGCVQNGAARLNFPDHPDLCTAGPR